MTKAVTKQTPTPSPLRWVTWGLLSMYVLALPPTLAIGIRALFYFGLDPKEVPSEKVVSLFGMPVTIDMYVVTDVLITYCVLSVLLALCALGLNLFGRYRAALAIAATSFGPIILGSWVL